MKKEPAEDARKAGEKKKRDPDIADTITSSVPQGSQDSLARDFVYFMANLELLKKIPQRVDEITEYIFSLANFRKSDVNITLRREGIASEDLGQLANYILHSERTDWTVRPSFYGAVILEYNSRMERIKSLLPKK